MHFSQLLTTAVLAGLTAGLTLPSDLGDGSYRVYIDDRGLEVHERANETSDGVWEIVYASSPKAVNSARAVDTLEKRGGTDCGMTNTGLGSQKGCFTTWCGCGFTLNHGDCDAAVADLKTQPEKYGSIGPYLSHYSIRGSVVAFACNIRGGLNGIGSVDYSDWMVTRVLQVVTDKCGWYIAGTGIYEDLFLDDEYPEIGYMRYSNGLDFCVAADSASAGSC
ncbi:hypothetical protein F5884DRAFT_317843 [Xylogone sp. PMI_703]|nr:hypothetical protein F5884DRAFT_317843 [Xylogone sp. PMI_703]